MSCPGGTTPCQSHGQCLDMKSLGTFASVEGQIVKTVISNTVTLNGYNYGSTPNDPATWDALRYVFIYLFLKHLFSISDRFVNCVYF
jgi:hypothetical protein